jgi:hypothetical protein
VPGLATPAGLKPSAVPSMLRFCAGVNRQGSTAFFDMRSHIQRRGISQLTRFHNRYNTADFSLSRWFRAKKFNSMTMAR